MYIMMIWRMRRWVWICVKCFKEIHFADIVLLYIDRTIVSSLLVKLLTSIKTNEMIIGNSVLIWSGPRLFSQEKVSPSKRHYWQKKSWKTRQKKPWAQHDEHRVQPGLKTTRGSVHLHWPSSSGLYTQLVQLILCITCCFLFQRDGAWPDVTAAHMLYTVLYWCRCCLSALMKHTSYCSATTWYSVHGQIWANWQ